MSDENGFIAPYEALRAALGVNQNANAIKRHIAAALTIPPLEDLSSHYISTYVALHRDAFSDMHSNTTGDMAAGDMIQGKRAGFRVLMNRLVEGLIDESKYFRTLGGSLEAQLDATAKLLAEFYIGMRELRPFAYGNELTLSAFVAYFCNISGFTSVNGRGLDFRKLSAEEASMLRRSSNVDEVADIFKAAMDVTRMVALSNKPNEYGKLHSHEITIVGIKLLGRVIDGREYVVTVNGGLVSRDEVEAQLIDHLKTKSISDFYVKPEKYLDVDVPVFGRAEQSRKLRDMREIDGYEVRENGAAPLVCLQSDIRTGLYHQRHAKLEQSLKGKGMNLHDLENHQIATCLIADETDPDIKYLLQLADRHIQLITRQIDAAKESLFDGKKPVANGEQPQLIFSMGGPGSGKGSVKRVAEACTNDNYVTASLDDARKASALYHLLRKIGHDADDYQLVEKFAFTMRDWTTKQARGKRYHLLYDGTGVDFKPRYDDIAKTFHDSGYYTTVAMVDTMFVVPNGREAECEEPVYKRIIRRFSEPGSDQRILPWKITVGKHCGVMESFLAASKSPNIDKTIAFCADGPSPDKAYLMAESFDLTPEDYSQHRDNNHAFGRENAINLLKDDPASLTMKMARYAAGKCGKTSDQEFYAAMQKIPGLKDDNTFLMCGQIDSRKRGLLMTNVHRIIGVAQKAMLNTEASGPSGVNSLGQNYMFVVPQDGHHIQGGVAQIPWHNPGRAYTENVEAVFSSRNHANGK